MYFVFDLLMIVHINHQLNNIHLINVNHFVVYLLFESIYLDFKFILQVFELML
jgi:hypothetical protein